MAEEHEPTIEEMLRVLHVSVRQQWESALTPKQREDLQHAIKAEYQRKQKPSAVADSADISLSVEENMVEPDNIPMELDDSIKDMRDSESLPDTSQRLSEEAERIAKSLLDVTMPKPPQPEEWKPRMPPDNPSLRKFEIGQWPETLAASAKSEFPEPREGQKLTWREVWTEIKKHRGWYLLAFLLSGLPLFIATLWGPIMGSKTIPEWLAEKGWPRLTTLVIGWIAVVGIIALVIIVRSYLSVKRKRAADDASSVSFELTRNRFERYDDDKQYILARFKYKTGLGHSPKVEVKANLTVLDGRPSLELPEFPGAWHGSIVRSKRFKDGDSADLVLGLVTSEGMIGYEYNVLKTVNGTELSPKLSELLKGKRFYIQVVFIGLTNDETKLFEKTQWFQIDAAPEPHSVGIAKPPSHLW